MRCFPLMFAPVLVTTALLNLVAGSTDEPYVKTPRDDVTRLHQAAGTCDNLKQCQNGGMCIPRDGHHFCDCLRGTSGDLCEIVDECMKIVDKCKDGSKCAFDVELEKAICDCADTNQKYDSVDGKCKKTCNEDAMCKNGGLCMHRGDYLFCQCKGGTRGHFCEIVDEDKCLKICGISSDTKDKEVLCEGGPFGDVTCKCSNAEEKSFDPITKQCRAPCSKKDDCENGADCINRGKENNKFCACLSGTSGSKCDNIIECDEDTGKYKLCKEDQGSCEYDKSKREAVCNCPDDKKLNTLKNYCEDLCSIYTCENGGTCYPEHGELMCLCPFPFYGDRCEHEKIDPCRNSTLFCENGGKCVLVNGSQVPVCLCPSPFYGERCELGEKDKSDKSLYTLIWVGCSAIILLVLVSGCLIVARCRKGGAS